MYRSSLVVLLVLALSGCGLAETAATGAAAAGTQAEAAKQAAQTEQQVQQNVDAAMQADADKRRAADDNADN